MRIAFFTETFLPKIDGIVNTLCYLLQHLAARGHASLLFAPEGGPLKYAQTPVIGLGAIPFPLYPELKLVPPHVDISRRLAAFQPDLIHVLNPFSLGVVGLNQARALQVPVVASYHTDIPGFAVRWGLGLFREPLWAYLRWLHNQADLNLCPSRTTQIELEAQGIQRTRIWSRGIDTSRFNPTHRSQAWRLRLSGGQPESPLLLYVGRLSPEKRVDWLRPVLTALPQVRLAIVGDGPARPELERLFAETPTVFTGYLQGDELARAYAAADMFVFPAANETLGNVVLEAMASGLPVVAARAGGVLDHVVEGETGLLFEPESQEALIAAVSRLLADEKYARQLGSSGRARVQPQSWAAVLDGLLADYTALIESRGPAYRSIKMAA
ncbi:MAG: glycosyltransferase family 1 protein [Anaerolineae bacterium]|nr:glycosyltransferase family 1 protein [Anaerolineae bacterium]